MFRVTATIGAMSGSPGRYYGTITSLVSPRSRMRVRSGSQQVHKAKDVIGEPAVSGCSAPQSVGSDSWLRSRRAHRWISRTPTFTITRGAERAVLVGDMGVNSPRLAADFGLTCPGRCFRPDAPGSAWHRKKRSCVRPVSGEV